MGKPPTETTKPLTILLPHSNRQCCPPCGTQSCECYCSHCTAHCMADDIYCRL